MFKSIKFYSRYVVTTVTVLGLFYFMISKMFLITKVETTSMSPTIEPNTILISSKDTSGVKRGDIVVFYSKEKDKLMVKRVVGLPGEHVVISGNKVIADSKEYKYSNVESLVYTDLGVVPNESYALIGDNVAESCDARYWRNRFIFKNCILGVVKKSFTI